MVFETAPDISTVEACDAPSGVDDGTGEVLDDAGCEAVADAEAKAIDPSTEA